MQTRFYRRTICLLYGFQEKSWLPSELLLMRVGFRRVLRKSLTHAYACINVLFILQSVSIKLNIFHKMWRPWKPYKMDLSHTCSQQGGNYDVRKLNFNLIGALPERFTARYSLSAWNHGEWREELNIQQHTSNVLIYFIKSSFMIKVLEVY